jgi:hypothetical protein
MLALFGLRLLCASDVLNPWFDVRLMTIMYFVMIFCFDDPILGPKHLVV